MAGLDVRDLLHGVVRPVLARFPAALRTVAAEQLLMGTAAVESGFTKLVQFNGGPARGIFQMEPPTFHWLRDGYLAGDTLRREEMRHAVEWVTNGRTPRFEELTWNLALAAAFARIRYVPFDRALPARDDVRGLGEYWKDGYNTAAGAGTVDEFERRWRFLVAPAELWRATF